jgi:hypothetical protein
MQPISRRKLLKTGAGGVLALGALAAGAGGASASPDKKSVALHIHGVLTRGTATLAISIDVAGRKDALAGGGWDSGTAAGPNGMVPTSVVGACYYTAAGKIDGDVVTLEGKSLFTNRPLAVSPEETPPRSDTRADGREFHGTANLETGEITWELRIAGASPNPFTGTGVVTLIH